MILSDETVCLVPQSYHDITKDSVIHIFATLPDDLSGINPQFIPLLDMVVQKGGQQIISGCDGMKITGKMQIQFIHGYYLCVTAAGSSSLDTEAGA